MGVVGFLSECIYNEYFKAFEAFDFLGLYRFNVRQVGEITNSVTKNLKPVVPGLYGSNPMGAQSKWLAAFYLMDVHRRSSRVAVFIGKDIVKSSFKGGQYTLVRVDRDIALSEKKGADIVNSGRVVSMLVGKQNSIQAFDGVAEAFVA